MVLGARQRRGGALALALGLLLPLGCAGGYPLPPTRCDDWCNVTRGLDACGGDYDPAGCVVACEAQGISAEGCVWAFEPALNCFRENPNAATNFCFYDELATPPCRTEALLLATCASMYADYQPHG